MDSVTAIPRPNASAIAIPRIIPFPIESGTITKASGSVQGITIIVSPVANENKNHPILPSGIEGARTKRYKIPKIIAAKVPIAAEISHDRAFAVCGVVEGTGVFVSIIYLFF
ncbi:MAG: hypothetical protein ACI92I_000843 [Acidimicrobiales bacterium]|jgi:hypothetical protein